MMIDDILSTCDSRFQVERHRKECPQCTYEGHCPDEYCECEKCLELIHYPDRVKDGAPARNYDCTHMADFYVCKYAWKYTSELIYAFSCLKNLSSERNLKVLSFGCGPCTDLLALDYLRWNDVYCFENLDYRGVDYGEEVWSNIHNDIKHVRPEEVQVMFNYQSAQRFIERIVSHVWIPDLVVFQYFFSDMNKNVGENEVIAFVKEFAAYVNAKMPLGSCIVLNDINLSNQFGGGRDCFDKLSDLIVGGHSIRRCFHNSNRPNTYVYGQKYDENKLLFNCSGLDSYNPFLNCSSAQMIIKKGGEET